MSSRAMRGLLALFRSERGGALVELAVVLPILVLIAIGVMDYGRVYYTSVTVANAARAAAEWGAYGRTGSSTSYTDIQNFGNLEGADAGSVTITTNPPLCRCSPTGAEVDCTTSCGGYGAPQVYVTAMATKSVTLILRYPGLPPSVTISRSATFRAQ